MREMIPLGAAHGAEENRLGAVARLDRRLGQGLAGRVDRGAAHERFLIVDGEAAAVGGGVDRAHGFLHDFGADAVAGENGYMMVLRHDDLPFSGLSRDGVRQPAARAAAAGSKRGNSAA